MSAPNTDGIVTGPNGEPVDLYEIRVADEMDKQRARRDAKRRLDAEERPALDLPPITSLADMLAEPDEDTPWLIERVMQADSRVMLAAQFKAGKTTLIGNLIRALADRTPFLGTFAVNEPPKRIVLIDIELSRRMLRAWLRDQGIENTAAVADVISLKGKAASFDLLDDQTRAAWVARLRGVEADFVILDCLRPILDALGLDENRDCGRFLTAFDALLADAGIASAVMVDHMGHAAERNRGDSRKLDWPDATWKLVRESEAPDSARFFSAYGRDVDVAEGRLSFDPATRRLTYSGGSRRDTETEAALVDVARTLASTPEPLSGRGVEDALAGTHKRTAIRKAIKRATAEGLVTKTAGPRNSTLHAIAHPCSRCGLPVASRREAHQSCPPPDAAEGVLWL